MDSCAHPRVVGASPSLGRWAALALVVVGACAKEADLGPSQDSDASTSKTTSESDDSSDPDVGDDGAPQCPASAGAKGRFTLELESPAEPMIDDVDDSRNATCVVESSTLDAALTVTMLCQETSGLTDQEYVLTLNLPPGQPAPALGPMDVAEVSYELESLGQGISTRLRIDVGEETVVLGYDENIYGGVGACAAANGEYPAPARLWLATIGATLVPGGCEPASAWRIDVENGNEEPTSIFPGNLVEVPGLDGLAPTRRVLLEHASCATGVDDDFWTLRVVAWIPSP